MSHIRIDSIKIQNYRSFGEEQSFIFPIAQYKKPIAIVGYNNSGKTNLMNCILYCLQVNFVSRDTFSINDFHDRDISKIPKIELSINSSIEKKYDGKDANLNGIHKLNIKTDGTEIEGSKIDSLNNVGRPNFQSFGATKYFNIFYINFHNIKEEISTQKKSWGNLKSFLAKHIKKLVDEDKIMKARKKDFQNEIKIASEKVLNGNNEEIDETKIGESKLLKFIKSIKNNYNHNLRDNNIEIDFSLPEYEDIFLQMVFKIGLNGSDKNLVPIDHFGDGYISMFVMAVIQAIAEEETEDKCLFLFEEPESFLHENHQEYFYKTVLCGLSENGHQVIYTTHSDRMIDIFDTKGLIRIELEDNQTIKKYNNTSDFVPNVPDEESNTVSFENYNDFIRTIEPNLNKILFSKKVILVEGPNDMMVYKYIIQKEIETAIVNRNDIIDKKKYAKTYLNFKNYAIIPHHGKSTAVYLAKLCRHFGLEYFMINDWDFEETELSEEKLSSTTSLDELKNTTFYKEADSGKKGMMTTNWKLIIASENQNLHFNIPKLEKIIKYTAVDKDSVKIFEIISSDDFVINENLFPKKLIKFLEIDKINNLQIDESNVNIDDINLKVDDDIPF